jgi:glycine betaine/choline ABC-type transport system substrate-binding protein
MYLQIFVAALGLMVTLVAYAGPAAAQTVVVRGKKFTEQLLIAEMTS